LCVGALGKQIAGGRPQEPKKRTVARSLGEKGEGGKNDTGSGEKQAAHIGFSMGGKGFLIAAVHLDSTKGKGASVQGTLFGPLKKSGLKHKMRLPAKQEKRGQSGRAKTLGSTTTYNPRKKTVAFRPQSLQGREKVVLANEKRKGKGKAPMVSKKQHTTGSGDTKKKKK